MSLPCGYQLYDLSLSRGRIHDKYSEKGREIFTSLEEMGLTVEMWYHKSKEAARIRVYHPNRAMGLDESRKIDVFYCVYNGSSFGYGFLDEVNPPDPSEWNLVYKSPPNIISEAENILASIPTDPDRLPSKAEIDFAIAATELNEEHKDTGEKKRKMQVDAMVRNAERVAKLVKSGKFRVLGVDTCDYSEGELISDFDTEENALMYIWLEREMNNPKVLKDSGRHLDLWHKCLWLDRGDMAREHKETFGVEDKNLIAQDIEPGITLEVLKKRLSKNYEPVTSDIDYLYDPEGNCIGKYPI